MLSVLIACRNIDRNVLRTIKSVSELNPQIIVGVSEHSEPLGIRKNRLIDLAAYEWILVLDTDEVVTPELRREIGNVLKKNPPAMNGYAVPYVPYMKGRALGYGGERYSRVILFRKSAGTYTPVPVHEHSVVKGSIGSLSGVIRHYSYTSLSAIIPKFLKYAWQMAGEKRKAKESVTAKKLLLYGPHMIWARLIKDQGWRDGWRGIVLAVLFGCMETLTYWFLLWRNMTHR